MKKDRGELIGYNGCCGIKWCESTIRGVLKNEKYIGDVLMGKTFTLDPKSHKRLSNL